ncbi:MAG: hypothetical protein ROY99_04945 [Ignavibacterium sp.]|jgi:hypothetical protein|nr:hypothetical protein [Ignavibacterium sp.]
MLKINYLFLSLFLIALFVLTISCNTTEPTEELKPGRRDYVWSVDSVDYDTLPGRIELYSIWGSSPTDVWGAGFSEDVRNCLWHYDGEKWNRAVWNTPITEFGNGSKSVGGVWGTAQNDVWAFGGRLFSNPERVEPFIMHYDGNQWKEVIGPKDQMPIGFRDIYALRKDHFWISSSDFVSEYKDGIWKKYFIGENYIIQSIEGIGANVYLIAYPIGIDSLFLMKLNGNKFTIVDNTSLFGQGKFGHLALTFMEKKVITADDYGIYEADVSEATILYNSWSTIVSTSSVGFANSLWLSNKNIWLVGNYIYPYHFNGTNWKEIDIYLGNNQQSENVFWGIWGDGNEIFIGDTENSVVYHGK